MRQMAQDMCDEDGARVLQHLHLQPSWLPVAAQAQPAWAPDPQPWSPLIELHASEHMSS
jgi:hypothetical protein